MDFGATDGPMTDEQIAAVKGNVLHVPTVLGAVVRDLQPARARRRPSSSFDGATAGRHLPGPDHQLERPPDRRPESGRQACRTEDIIVVHRSDGSGTTFIFTDYLSKVSPEWKTQGRQGYLGQLADRAGRQGQRRRDPAGQAVPGQHRLRRADLRHLQQAAVRRRSRTRQGEFVEPTLKSVAAAAAGAKLPPDTDFRVSITNAAGPDAYPISSFTWLLVRKDRSATAPRARTIARFPDVDARAGGPADGGRPALRAAAGAGDRAGAASGSR